MNLSPAAINYLSQKKGVVFRWLFWIEAKHRDTGAPETLGLWTGADHRLFDVEGESRTYVGAGGLVGLDGLTYEAGSVVRIQTISVSPINPQVEAIVRGYETRLAPVQVHLLLMDRSSLNPVTFESAFEGEIDHISFPRPQIGSTSVMSIDLASTSRVMTKGLSYKKSDENQQRRNGDRFRRYGAVAGSVPVWWGEYRAPIPTENDSSPVAETAPPIVEEAR